jgi:hypothetical protein
MAKKPTRQAPKQATQAQVHYRPGTPTAKCGNCLSYNIGDRDFQFGRCERVTGNITTFGLCDLYRRIRSPFARALTNEEMHMLEQWYWERAQEKGYQGPISFHADFETAKT